MLSLNLSQKGILVVGATLLLQLLFVFVMTSLLKDTYEQMQRERQVTEIILQINKASELGDKLLVGLSQEVSIPDDPHSKEFYVTYKQYLELLPKQVTLLEDMVRGTDQEKAMNDLASIINDGVRSVE